MTKEIEKIVKIKNKKIEINKYIINMLFSKVCLFGILSLNKEYFNINYNNLKLKIKKNIYNNLFYSLKKVRVLRYSTF